MKDKNGVEHCGGICYKKGKFPKFRLRENSNPVSLCPSCFEFSCKVFDYMKNKTYDELVIK